MLHNLIALSVILGFVSFEFLGLLSGGMVTAGYLAFYYTAEPYRLVSTILMAILITLVVKLLQRYLILFGRRRFMLTIVLSVIASYIFEFALVYVFELSQDIRIVGYIVPGLIANDMEKQGIVKTLLVLMTIAALLTLILQTGILTR